MKRALRYAVLFCIAANPLYAQTYEYKQDLLTVKAEGIDAGGFIAPEYAFCVTAKTGHVQEGTDKSIGLSWSKGPKGTKSYAVIGVDPDVPTVFDDAGKEGKT